MSSQLGWSDLLRYGASFFFVIALLLALLWALKRLQGGALMARKHQQLQIIEALSLGPRQKLVLIQVADQRLLLGVTAGQIQTLATLPAGDPTQAAKEAV
jgi:flagellar protein FliO/FliZ